MGYILFQIVLILAVVGVLALVAYDDARTTELRVREARARSPRQPRR